MSELKTKVEFDLTEPLKYASGGDEVFTSKLILMAPRGKHIEIASELKQCFFQAINEFQEQGKTQEATASKSEAIEDHGALAIMLYMSKTDIKKCYRSFKALMLDDCCIVDNNKKLTDSLFDKISVADIERMLGAYLENFMIPSGMI